MSRAITNEQQLRSCLDELLSYCRKIEEVTLSISDTDIPDVSTTVIDESTTPTWQLSYNEEGNTIEE